MKQNIIYPDYKNSILNITNSILNRYGAKPYYSTLSVLDKVLEKNHKNTVVIIMDGMGDDMLKNNLSESSFLRSNQRGTLTSVFPSSTVPATTAYYSGLSPLEHSWLGWSLYFKEFARYIDIYPECDTHTKEKVNRSFLDYVRYESTDKKMRGIENYFVCPSGIIQDYVIQKPVGVGSVEEMFDTICRLCNAPNEKYILAYWFWPDYEMHEYGCYAASVRDFMKNTDNQIKLMCEQIQDSVIIVSADHGLIDVNERIPLDEIPEITECLIMPPFIESRAMTFFVKPDMKQAFEQRFNHLFSEDYSLFSKEDVLDRNLLGTGTAHPKALDFLGDFLACAIGERYFSYETDLSVPAHNYAALHGGLTEKEMIVPLIVIES